MPGRRILLSAFACAPGWGGEPGVGWQWARSLARNHAVTVLTHERFRAHIEAAEAADAAQAAPAATPAGQIRFCYLGRPGPEAQMQRQVDSHAHYLAWQFAARAQVRRLLAEQAHDLVHHLTWGSWRLPTHLGGLGAPLVIGPVGGGDDAPAAWMKSWPRAERARYALRSAWTASGRWDPLACRALAQARLILAKTEATRQSLPAWAREKTRLALELGCPAPASLAPQPAPLRPSLVRPLRLLYVGRLIGGKGVGYAVDATLALAAGGLPVHLRVVGQGRLGEWLRQRVARSAAPQAVTLAGACPFEQLPALYRSHDLLVFPSWHDSSGNVVAEALAHGLPVVCLDRAGPAAITDARCAVQLRGAGLEETGLVAALAAALADLAQDPARRARLAHGALQRAAELQWPQQVARVYADIETTLGWNTRRAQPGPAACWAPP